MALAPSITSAVAQAMMVAFNTAVDAGTAAVINIYDNTGGAPADANASIGTCVLLAQLTMSATAFGTPTTANPSVATANSITSDTSADATGAASFYRILTQSGGTVLHQGSVGTATANLVLNTVSITSGSTVAITAATVSLPAS
jgi:hypothetical protein